MIGALIDKVLLTLSDAEIELVYDFRFKSEDQICESVLEKLVPISLIYQLLH